MFCYNLREGVRVCFYLDYKSGLVVDGGGGSEVVKMDNMEVLELVKVVGLDLRPRHPVGRKSAGSQPSASLSRFGSGPRRSERG